jgi:hypothetical protein
MKLNERAVLGSPHLFFANRKAVMLSRRERVQKRDI